MIKIIVDRVMPLAAIVIFAAALVVLYRQFADVSLASMVDSLESLAWYRLVAAAGLAAASYLLLTGYDFLALRFVGKRLKTRQVLLASFAAFAFSNNIGFQLFSGGSMRFRIYSNLGLSAGDIGNVVAFCTFTYVLGVVTVGGLVFTLQSAEMSALLNLPRPLVGFAGAAMLGVTGGYLLLAALRRRPTGRPWFGLRMPTLALAMAQVTLASADAVLAGAVMYVLLPANMALGFQSFVGIYTIANTVAVFSLIPGGLGVFETAITLMTAPPSKAAVLATLLAYRVIYFILPFVLAIALFSWHEMRRLRI